MSNRIKVLILVAILVVGGAVVWSEFFRKNKFETSSERTARGPGFEVPVPAGYQIVTGEELSKMAPGGVILRSDATTDGQMRHSIAIVPVPATPGSNPRDDAACKSAIAGIENTGVTVQRVGMVSIGSGQACQWAAAGQKTDQAALSTVMAGAGDRTYVVTCNHDKRETSTPKACDEVLTNWRPSASP